MFFALSVVSALLLLVCAYLFLCTEYSMAAMILVGCHAGAVLIYFGLGEAVGVALPLIFLRNELRRT